MNATSSGSSYPRITKRSGDPASYGEVCAEAADQFFICHGDPITPDELRDYQAAFEQLWTGVPTPSRESMLIGVEQVTADIHDIGIYRFLVPADTIAVG